MNRTKLLVCGATGFIGRNLVDFFLKQEDFELSAVYHEQTPPQELDREAGINWIKADLRKPQDVDRAVAGQAVVIQAAATTTGAKDTLTKPHHHVTDNAAMNAFLFRACHEHRVEHVVFLSCTTMYPPQEAPVREDDFNGQIFEKYFGGAWTKVYNEKMCEFYSKIGPAKYTAIRHSNIYGPYDKYDLERSHVFGATVAKVMTAGGGKVIVWGDGSEERDLLYVDDLTNFIALILRKQNKPFELVNAGLGASVSIDTLVKKIVQHSGRNLKIEYDRSKPSIGFKLKLNIDRAKKMYGWVPRISLDEGIQKTLEWYRRYCMQSPVTS